MLSINQKKYISSLQLKKFRTKHGTFLVEGKKMIEELLQSDFEIESIYTSEKWLNEKHNAITISDREMSSISALSTPSSFLATVFQKNNLTIQLTDNLTLVLDNIKDPGNLGTIIRTADWFGITNIVCSAECVDVYNPKVVQATMGSIFRVNITYTDLEVFFKSHIGIPVYAATMSGDNLFTKKLQQKNVIFLMGSESFGVHESLMKFVTQQLTIPNFGKAESLNVAVATGIMCASYRQQFKN